MFVNTQNYLSIHKHYNQGHQYLDDPGIILSLYPNAVPAPGSQRRFPPLGTLAPVGGPGLLP